jgi:hypothetical protein
MFKDRQVIREYLVQSGFMDNYFIWTKHDERQVGTKNIINDRAEENQAKMKGPSKEDHLSIDFGCRKNPCLPEPLHPMIDRLMCMSSIPRDAEL